MRVASVGVKASLLAAVAFGSANASAHIRLLAPPSWVVENAEGDPQKTPPCGGTGTATGAVTTFHTGETITVKWQETVGHPGHFRISLAMNRADLIDPKVVTSTGDGVTGTSISAAIESPVAYPVLLDGLFPRTSVAMAQAAPFTQQVTLPKTPCDHCTLQVLQFMAGHPPGYFYHHCADITIVDADAATGGTGGAPAVGAGGASAAAGGTTSSGAGGTTSSGTGGVATAAGDVPSSGTGGALPTDAGRDGASGQDRSSSGCAVAVRGPSEQRSSSAMFVAACAAMMLRRRRAR